MARGRFFIGLQNYLENKTKGNEHKIILGDFNSTMYKMDMYSGNKTRSIYRCPSNYTLLKLIVYIDRGSMEKGEPLIELMINPLLQDPG